jgi:hypothetical protein
MIEDKTVSVEIDNIIDKIVARVVQITDDETGKDVRSDLETIREQIGAVADGNGTWKKQSKNSNPRYMRRPNEFKGSQGGKETPQSMRDVDPPCAIVIQNNIRRVNI